MDVIVKKFKETIEEIKKSSTTSISVFFIFFITILMFIVYLFNPFQINHIIPRLLLLFFVSIITISIIIYAYISKTNDNITDNRLVDNKARELFQNAFVFLKIFGYIFIGFILFSILYYILRYVLVNSKNSSFVITILTLIFILCTYYSINNDNNGKIRNKKDGNYYLEITEDIIKFIPCLVIDIMEYVKKDIKLMPKSSYIFLGILIIIMVLFYIIPFIQKVKFTRDNYVSLVNEATELNQEVVYMTHDTLKQKQIESKPFFQRKLLQQTSIWEKQIEATKSDSLLDQINTYENIRIFTDNSGTLEYMRIKDLSYCIGRTVTCDPEKNALMCVDKKDENIKTYVANVHGMYQQCGSRFSNLFQRDNTELFMKQSQESTPITFQEYCDTKDDICGNNISVSCINVYDLSGYLLNNEDYIDTSYSYVCNDLDLSQNDDKKYYLISGYNDISKEKLSYKCNENNVYEGFEGTMYNPDIHQLDDTIENTNLFDILSPSETKIIEKAMQEDSGNFANKLKQLTDKADINNLYMEYLSNHTSYSTIISNIHELHRVTNEYIQQESSNLVNMINRLNNIYDYNYHYGISFWIYFDPELLKSHSNEIQGDIFNYAHMPYIYYHFKDQELVMEVNECSTDFNKSNPISCIPKVIYKSKDVLFQKWNNIVINYDYGTLDLFVNNILVATKQNVIPYINKDENNIVIGSFKKPLTHAGICNARYYSKPLNLKQIKELYSNKESPCK